MLLVDFDINQKTALKKGFFKGLAAPVLLFGNFDLPEQEKIPQVKPINLPDAQSLTQDMEVIGKDFIRAIDRTK